MSCVRPSLSFFLHCDDGLTDGSVNANEAGEVSDDELRAQTTTFLVAGAETTSGALCRILHQLAMAPAAQERLRAEIVRALDSKCDGDENGDGLEYDELMALPYLDAVCKETLRAFAPSPYRNRRYAKSSFPYPY